MKIQITYYNDVVGSTCYASALSIIHTYTKDPKNMYFIAILNFGYSKVPKNGETIVFYGFRNMLLVPSDGISVI